MPEQHGLVRSRNKYGLRIPQPSFAKVFAQLKPGTEVPATIDVKCLYKLGPVPASARAEDVQSWAQQLSWQVKVLKALGPQFWLVGAATGPQQKLLSSMTRLSYWYQCATVTPRPRWSKLVALSHVRLHDRRPKGMMIPRTLGL